MNKILSSLKQINIIDSIDSSVLELCTDLVNLETSTVSLPITLHDLQCSDKNKFTCSHQTILYYLTLLPQRTLATFGAAIDKFKSPTFVSIIAKIQGERVLEKQKQRTENCCKKKKKYQKNVENCEAHKKDHRCVAQRGIANDFFFFLVFFSRPTPCCCFIFFFFSPGGGVVVTMAVKGRVHCEKKTRGM